MRLWTSLERGVRRANEDAARTAATAGAVAVQPRVLSPLLPRELGRTAPIAAVGPENVVTGAPVRTSEACRAAVLTWEATPRPGATAAPTAGGDDPSCIDFDFGRFEEHCTAAARTAARAPVLGGSEKILPWQSSAASHEDLP
jgi:hypothetical protein